jgi:hypothetical protein
MNKQTIMPADQPPVIVVEPLVYTIDELAKVLKLSRVTLWRLERRGLLKSVPGVRHKIYSRRAVEKFLEG